MTEQDCADFFDLLQTMRAPAHLRRRRNHLRRCGGISCGSSPAEFQIPVVTTLMGIGSVDTTDKLSLHMLGMHGMAYANYAVMDCDFLITIGARFDDRVAGKGAGIRPQGAILRTHRYRRRGNRQGEIRNMVPCGLRPGSVEPISCREAEDFKQGFLKVAGSRGGSQEEARPQLRPREQSDSAALRDRMPERNHAGRSDRLHGRGPAPDVGRTIPGISNIRGPS